MLNLYKRPGAPSFLTTLLIHTTTPTILTNNRFLYSSQFSPPLITSSLDYPIIHTITTNTPFPYTLAIFRLNIFTYSHSENHHKEHFPLPIQAASKTQWASEFCVAWHCFNISLIPQNMDRDNTFTITDFLLLILSKSVYCR